MYNTEDFRPVLIYGKLPVFGNLNVRLFIDVFDWIFQFQSSISYNPHYYGPLILVTKCSVAANRIRIRELYPIDAQKN